MFGLHSFSRVVPIDGLSYRKALGLEGDLILVDMDDELRNRGAGLKRYRGMFSHP